MPPVKSMDMSRSEFDWFRDKQFTTDFVTLHIPSWDAVLRGLRGQNLKVLEIGSWEGRSAVFWLEYFPNSDVTCIDTFSGEGEELDGNSAEGIEARFDANTAPYGQRVRKIKSASVIALPNLKGEKFDLIYIDGCHLRDEALIDSLLSWPLLSEGGHVIWDDYYFGADDGRSSAERPQQSIDVFIELHREELEVLHVDSQVIARRVGNRSAKRPGIAHSRTLANLWRFIRRMPMRDARGALEPLRGSTGAAANRPVK
jgi:predicted O-methyltransferase YrrM